MRHHDPNKVRREDITLGRFVLRWVDLFSDHPRIGVVVFINEANDHVLVEWVDDELEPSVATLCEHLDGVNGSVESVDDVVPYHMYAA